MPSRCFHHKRRHGCSNCKQRKIRCQEERPSCQNCIRLGGRCSFLDADHVERLATPPPAQQQPCADLGQTSLQFHLTPANLHHYDVELMIHYSTRTCLTVTDEVDLFPTWQSTIPALASSFPFLEHGLLALSAMHRRLTSLPHLRPLYTELARHHQGKALESYIPQLETITEESCPALFAFSSILPALSYSFLQSVESDLQGEDYVTRFVETWNFLMGATVVAKEAAAWIRQSILSPLLTLKSLENVLPCLSDEPHIALQGLVDQIAVDGWSSTPKGQDQNESPLAATQSVQLKQNDTYKSSIEMLSNAFHTKDGKPPRLGAVIGWPVFVDKDFLQLLKRRDPMALTILAHYGAALHSFNGFWWLQDLGVRLVQSVSQILGSDFSQHLRWPLAKVSSAD